MSDTHDPWPAMPTETEIYILPNGEIIVADLPAELAALIAQFTQLECLDQSSISAHDTDEHDLAQPA